MQCTDMIDIISFYSRLLDRFRTVFSYTALNRHTMDTEKDHSIQHCYVDVTNHTNHANHLLLLETGRREGTRAGPEDNQGSSSAKRNQGSSSAKGP